MSREFTSSEKVLHDALVAKFGTLKAARQDGEDPSAYFQRVTNAGLLKQATRAAMRDVRNYTTLKNAEGEGAVVQIMEPEPAPTLVFDRSQLRTLDGYKTAKAAAAKVGKEVGYE